MLLLPLAKWAFQHARHATLPAADIERQSLSAIGGSASNSIPMLRWYLQTINMNTKGLASGPAHS
jgi:hypothetical protein